MCGWRGPLSQGQAQKKQLCSRNECGALFFCMLSVEMFQPHHFPNGSTDFTQRSVILFPFFCFLLFSVLAWSNKGLTSHSLNKEQKKICCLSGAQKWGKTAWKCVLWGFLPCTFAKNTLIPIFW